jgi:hypothetical protein
MSPGLSMHIVEEIGASVGLRMYPQVPHSACYTEAYRDSYYRAVLESREGDLVLRYRKCFADDGSSAYVLNLKTMTPTRQSPIQTPVSSELRDRLRTTVEAHMAYLRSAGVRPIGEI